ncbi:DUF3040 domain-containing protein, partial [Pseudonocardia nigra]|uniref:DUF3040 domain-containing protein n=1 Tax=Pseudonocardia nigra TaxID=1921578 RepID=UPI001C5F9693
APSRALLDPAAYLDAPKNSRRANEEKINYNNRGLTGPAPSGTRRKPAETGSPQHHARRAGSSAARGGTMLSQDDQCRLRAIEQQLQSDDPDLARRLTGTPPSTPARWATTAAILVVTLAALGVLLGLLLFSPALLALSGPSLLGWIGLRRRKRATRECTGETEH